MRSLVTGGAGFIGSHLVDALCKRGDEVLVIDNLSTGRRANLGSEGRDLELATGDIADARFVAERIGEFRPDRVFHLAAQADVRKAAQDPAFDARVNLIGTINVLQAAMQAGCPPFVFASTGGAIYGEGSGRALPFAESAAVSPESPYGASKKAGEVYVGLYRRLHGMPALALRFGNVFGPRQDPYGEAGVVAIFSARLRDGEPPTIFGDGRQTRDYVYVGDVVDALLAGERALVREGTAIEGPFNIGTGNEVSVLELLGAMLPIAGSDAEPEFAPERRGEVQRVAIDPAAAARELGWAPRTSLSAGLERTVASIIAS